MAKYLRAVLVAVLAPIVAVSSGIAIDEVSWLIVLIAAFCAQFAGFLRAKSIWRDAFLFVVRTLLATAVFTGAFSLVSNIRLFAANPDALFSYEMLYQKTILVIVFVLIVDFFVNTYRRRI